MHEEIIGQKDVLNSVIKKRVRNNFISFPELDKTSFLEIKRFIFIGCGSSYHAALFGNLVFEEIAKLNCEAEFADEFNKRNPIIEPHTAVVALSQSGETKEVIKALKIVGKKILKIGITNNKKSKIAGIVDAHLDLNAGKELAVPATKTFTSQLLVLILMALYAKQSKGGKIIEDINILKILPKKIKTVLSGDKAIKNIAQKFIDKKELMILGDKFNYPIALEASLKLKEAADVFAEGMATAEFEHGPKALGGLEVIRINNNKIDINRRKISIPKINEILDSILFVIPFQLLAFHLAILKKINPDSPKKIKKFIS